MNCFLAEAVEVSGGGLAFSLEHAEPKSGGMARQGQFGSLARGSGAEQAGSGGSYGRMREVRS